MSEISEAIKQKAAEMESENDLITIPRGLLGAALAVIKRPERDSANVIELLRYYAFAKEAQVVLRERAEPIAYIFKHPVGKLFWTLTDESNKDHADVMPVYAAPPTQVVPDAIPETEIEDGNDIDYMEPSAIYELGKTHGWNACRAAMLQHVSQPFKLKEKEE